MPTGLGQIGDSKPGTHTGAQRLGPSAQDPRKYRKIQPDRRHRRRPLALHETGPDSIVGAVNLARAGAAHVRIDCALSGANLACA